MQRLVHRQFIFAFVLVGLIATQNALGQESDHEQEVKSDEQRDSAPAIESEEQPDGSQDPAPQPVSEQSSESPSGDEVNAQSQEAMPIQR